MRNIRYITVFLIAVLLSLPNSCYAENGFSKFFKKAYHTATEVDSNYCDVLPWDASAELRTSMDQEVINVYTPDGMHMKMASELSYKAGPYIGYGPLKVGYMFRLNPTGRKANVDLSLSLNTNLFNFDVIYRRTGGDFNFRDVSYPGDNGLMNKFAKLPGMQDKFSNLIYNNVFGIRFNWIPNRKKYSNIATTSYGYVQKKSAGSPIFGLGYTYQKLETEISLATSIMGFIYLKDASGQPAYKNPNLRLPDGRTFREAVLSLQTIENPYVAAQKIKEVVELSKSLNIFTADNNSDIRRMLYNCIPHTMKVYDWHLQLGYGYNLVLSRHFMIGAQFIAMPGVKHITADNDESVGEILSRDQAFSQTYLSYLGGNHGIHINHTSLAFDFNARLSARWYHKHWYAGLTGLFNSYYYDKNDLYMNYHYWTVELAAGYNFNMSSIFKKKKRL